MEYYKIAMKLSEICDLEIVWDKITINGIEFNPYETNQELVWKRNNGIDGIELNPNLTVFKKI